MHHNPIAYYQELCKQGKISEDHHQLQVLNHLQRIYIDLLKEHKRRSGILFPLKKPGLVTGAYIWGDVGVGKTLLLDCLYECLPFPNKLRTHFHSFMHFIHEELKSHQGKKDPLKFVANDIAKKYLILCFDEFIVTDIVDAMILARLFRLLFSHGVCLITTSNAMPDDLYKHGLQRKSFLPTISLLKQHTEVIHLPGTKDYRRGHLTSKDVFYIPNDELSHNRMEEKFIQLADGIQPNAKSVEILGRSVPVIKLAANIIWFDFDVICRAPRSQHDYLAIADKYKTVFISNVKHIPAHANNRIALLIRMIDVFYDAHVCLVISSSVEIADIYTKGYMESDFKRTLSRMTEMQSDAWLEK